MSHQTNECSVSGLYSLSINKFVGSIESNFFQTWKDEFFDPETYTRLKNFRDGNLDFDFHFFDDNKMANYMKNIWAHHPISDIFFKTQFGAAKADIWRYCILYDMGGIYLDIDAALNFRLSSIPTGLNELISFESNSILRNISFDFKEDIWFLENFDSVRNFLIHPENLVLNWCMIFKSKHPVLKTCIDLICLNADNFRGKRFPNMLNAVIHFTGPHVLTKAIWIYAIEQGIPISQLGIDFDGLGLYKSNSGNAKYLNDATHYSRQDGKVLLQT